MRDWADQRTEQTHPYRTFIVVVPHLGRGRFVDYCGASDVIARHDEQLLVPPSKLL